MYDGIMLASIVLCFLCSIASKRADHIYPPQSLHTANRALQSMGMR